MNLFDEIREDMKDIHELVTTVDEIFEGLKMVFALTPLLRAGGISAERRILLHLASIAISGLEIVDAEIEARKNED